MTNFDPLPPQVDKRGYFTSSRNIFRTERGCVLITQQILLGDKNATYLFSKIISTLKAGEAKLYESKSSVPSILEPSLG